MKRHPKLRTDLVTKNIPGYERPYISVKDPVAQSYFKFEEWEFDLIRLFDGSRDENEIAEIFNEMRPGMGVDAQTVADFAESMRKAELLERTEQEKHLAMMDQMKTFRKKRFYDAESSTLFNIEIPLFDPNKLLDATIGYLRWWWSPWFVIPWLVVFTVVLGYLFYQWDFYWAGFWNLLNPAGKDAWHWVKFIVLLFFLGIWHELGHGYTCKHYGGEVHNIGIMLFYLEPAFYCKVDDSYMFPKRSHRAYVIFGGSYFEMMLCSLALLLWLTTPVEWAIHEYSLIFVLLSGLSLVLLNLNPLVKLDGYYLLMELLDVEDLRENSFQYMGNLLKKHIFHLEVSQAPVSRRRRRIYLIYGACSILYTSTIMLFIYGFIEGWMVDWFGPAGYLIIVLLIAWAFRKKVRDGVRFMKHVWLDKKEWIQSPMGITLITAVILGGIILATVPRTATRIEAVFTVEPGERAVVRAPADGVIRRVSAAEGTRVAAGEVLAVLENPVLEAEHALALADLERLRREATWAHRNGDAVLEQQRTREAREAEDRAGRLKEKLARMRLASPLAGVVTTARMDEKVGSYLVEGDALCSVDRLDRVRLAVEAPELDIEELDVGTPVRMLAAAFPARTIEATVLSVSARAVEPTGGGEQMDIVRRSNRVRVWMEVRNSEGLLRPGMTGRAQFLTSPRSLAGKTWWHFHRWATSVVW